MQSRIIRTSIWFLAAAISAAGMWLSYELTLEHLQVPREQEGILSEVCDSFTTASCEEVSQSHWAVFPFGAEKDQFHLPTAELGLFYFTSTFIWFILIGVCTPPRWWIHFIFTLITAFGLGASVFLDVVMWTQLDRWCPLCLATHVASLLLFIFTLLLWPRNPPLALEQDSSVHQKKKNRDKAPHISDKEENKYASNHALWPQLRMLAVIPIVTLLAIGIEFLLLTPSTGWAQTTPETEELHKKLKAAQYSRDRYRKHYEHYKNNWHHNYLDWQLSPPVNIKIEDQPYRGSVNARHIVVIYSDFQCPSCKKFETWFNRYIIPLGRNPSVGGIRVIFKHWPISTDCNIQAQRNLHPSACQASYATEAARIVGGIEAFWKMHDLLFKYQKEWKNSRSFMKLAKRIGLDEKAFQEAMNSQEAHERVKAHITEGVTLANELVEKKLITNNERDWVKVNSTPAIFIDNKRLVNWRYINTWKKILGYSHPEVD